MYLSRLRLDISKRGTMKALASPNLFHGAIESAFTGDRQRNLWRVDRLRGDYYILLLSKTPPELTSFSQQFGFQDEQPPWLTKDYSGLLERITQGGKWNFRLVANPTISCSAKHSEARGAVRAHITPEYQKKWLSARAEKHGFSLNEDEFLITQSKWLMFFKGSPERNRVTLLSVTYEGLLTVTDAEAFRHTLTEGVGRGKAYGMGLLTIIRPEDSGDG